MAILTAEEAQELTSPHHAIYVAAYEKGWDNWTRGQTEIPDLFKDLDSGTRFSLINRWVTAEVDRSLGGLWLTTGGPPILVHPIKDRAVVRFKHLNGEGLRPTSYPTGQQELLMEQAYTSTLWDQLRLNGFALPPTLLTCGYTLTPSEDALSLIAIVCHTPEFRFYYDLRDDGGAEVIPLPGFPPSAPRVVSEIAEEQEREQNNEM